MGIRAMGIKHPRSLALFLALLATAAGLEAFFLHRDEMWNRAIARGADDAQAMAAAITANAPVEMIFAEAYHAARAGDVQTALNLYKLAEQSVRREFGLAARYNSANLYLREALRLRDTDGGKNALPMAELAKEAYRGVLRGDSRYWDAKYNFERTLRAFPDWGAQAGLSPPEQAERAVTTMRGFTLGLP